MKESESGDLNKKDVKDIAVMVLFTGIGAMAVYFVDVVLPGIDFGDYAPYITPFIPVVTYAIKKWIQGK